MNEMRNTYPCIILNLIQGLCAPRLFALLVLAQIKNFVVPLIIPCLFVYSLNIQCVQLVESKSISTL